MDRAADSDPKAASVYGVGRSLSLSLSRRRRRKASMQGSGPVQIPSTTQPRNRQPSRGLARHAACSGSMFIWFSVGRRGWQGEGRVWKRRLACSARLDVTSLHNSDKAHWQPVSSVLCYCFHAYEHVSSPESRRPPQAAYLVVSYRTWGRISLQPISLAGTKRSWSGASLPPTSLLVYL